MQTRRTTLTTTVFFLLFTGAPLSSAEPDSRGDRRPPPPPPEAIEACKDKKEDAGCSFSGRRGEEVFGTCISPPGLDSLVCAPEGGPPGRPPHSDHRDRG